VFDRILGIRIMRIAGQYAKPRSKPTEVIDGREVLSFRGDNVNGYSVDDRRSHVRKGPVKRFLKIGESRVEQRTDIVERGGGMEIGPKETFKKLSLPS
jgi:hypothetical protein